MWLEFAPHSLCIVILHTHIPFSHRVCARVFVRRRPTLSRGVPGNAQPVWLRFLCLLSSRSLDRYVGIPLCHCCGALCAA